jgi:hypothetical protein
MPPRGRSGRWHRHRHVEVEHVQCLLQRKPDLLIRIVGENACCQTSLALIAQIGVSGGMGTSSNTPAKPRAFDEERMTVCIIKRRRAGGRDF